MPALSVLVLAGLLSLSRILLAAVMLAAPAAPATARAQLLDEQAVIRLARRNAPEARLQRAQLRAARLTEETSGLYPDPSVRWAREDIPDQFSADEVALSVPIDLSGRRAASAAVARSKRQEAAAAAAQARGESARQALRLFYRALAEQERATIADEQVERLDEAARVLARRTAEGTAAGYEQARLQVEAELARSQSHEAAANAAALRAELAALLGAGAEDVQLRGSLAPAAPPVSLAPNQQPQAEQPSLQRAHAAVRASRQARAAARSAWLPTLSLSGGLRVERTDRARLGYVAGVQLALPLFSGGRAQMAAAAAQALNAESSRLARVMRQRIERARARQLLAHYLGELARLRAATDEPLRRVLQATLSAYREGQLGLLELVDAQRMQTDVALRCLELALAARLAEVELRAARGEFE